MSCCVLHNICIHEGDEFENRCTVDTQQETIEEDQEHEEHEDDARSQILRNMNFFFLGFSEDLCVCGGL
ncbi:hypothetical protein QE152_g33546 [Popillia japonica]|uniref:Uncharacterized protein n=1 Tax=Popillia japonica TaxID=7064 RepID=A0AAW1IWE9_POPJA